MADQDNRARNGPQHGPERAIHAAQETGRVASGISLVIRAAVHTGEIEPESFWRARRSASLIAACAS
jgi:hypothetical protein